MIGFCTLMKPKIHRVQLEKSLLLVSYGSIETCSNYLLIHVYC